MKSRRVTAVIADDEALARKFIRRMLKDEDDIEFWHDLDTGYAGRERL